MSNRLASESSLYLKQHADNPVEWWPWCQEALDLAEKEGKLLLISIGYSSCHWCHVMAHECFEDEFIAKLMNDNFVCIKVDREERPDIDQIYMEAVQMLTQRGGWPLNVFCLPTGEPFFGGTYFPAKDKGQGIVPWPQLLMRIAEHYKRNPEEFLENGANIVKNLSHTNNPNAGVIKNEDHEKFVLGLSSTYDEDWGGFGSAPKFPPSMILDFFLGMRSSAHCDSKPALGEKIDQTVEGTLKAMAHGGIYDQLGGGFMRYSVDRYWLVPHFEKMLYDNGLLLSLYAQGWRQYRNPLYKRVLEEIFDWLERDMRTDQGPWAASMDADSGGEEGAYYVWSRDEIFSVLGDEEGKLFCDAYNVNEEGNFTKETSVLAWMYVDAQKRDDLKLLRDKLLAHREKRDKPTRDDKLISGWNALVIKGLAEAGYALGEKAWVKRAMEVGDWIWENMQDSGRLSRVYASNNEGYLDDYAYLISSCLTLVGVGDWLEAGSSEKYLECSKALMHRLFEAFRDPQMPGFYYTSKDHEHLLVRKKVWWDEAIPSGNGVLVSCLSELYALTGEAQYSEELEDLRKAFGGIAHKGANGVASALAGYVKDAVGIAVLKTDEDLELIRKVLVEKGLRKTFALKTKRTQLCVGPQCQVPEGEVQDWLRSKI